LTNIWQARPWITRMLEPLHRGRARIIPLCTRRLLWDQHKLVHGQWSH
jgi:hypothetical protein